MKKGVEKLKKIVVIDPSPAHYSTLKYALENRYEVESAKTFIDGLALMTKFPPDLVIIEPARLSDDGHYETNDGLETIRRIKESWPSTSVIVATAVGDESSHLAIGESGADKLITRYFGRNELLAAIRDLIGE